MYLFYIFTVISATICLCLKDFINSTFEFLSELQSCFLENNFFFFNFSHSIETGWKLHFQYRVWLDIFLRLGICSCDLIAKRFFPLDSRERPSFTRHNASFSSHNCAGGSDVSKPNEMQTAEARVALNSTLKISDGNRTWMRDYRSTPLVAVARYWIRKWHASFSPSGQDGNNSGGGFMMLNPGVR